MKKVLIFVFIFLVAFSVLSAYTEKHPITPHRVVAPLVNPQRADAGLTNCYPDSSSYWTGSLDYDSDLGTYYYSDDNEVRGCGTEDGWFMFDLSAIPEDANITRVDIHLYVNDTYYPYWGLYAVPDNPLTTDAATIRSEIYNGSTYLYREEDTGFTTGWHSFTLTDAARTDLQAALANDWWVCGLNETDDDDTYWIDIDGWNDEYPPFITVIYDCTGCTPQSEEYWTGTLTSSAYTDVSEVRGCNTEDGWFMFDVSEIPDGAFISNIEFYGYVNDTHYPYWGLYSVADNPLITDAATIRYDIDTGSTYLYREEDSDYAEGWHNYTLNDTARTDLQAALANDWWVCGMNETDDMTSYWICFDGWNEGNPPYIIVDYSLNPLPGYATDPYPTNGAFGTDQYGVNLMWTWGANTDTYELYFGTDYPPTTMIASGAAGSEGTMEVISVGDLDSMTHYFWYVNTINADGTSCPGVWSFTTFMGPNDLTIGSTIATGCSLPMEPWYGYSYSQTIYQQDQIEYEGGQIEQLYYVATSNSGFVSDIVVYLAHTEQDTLSDWLPINQFTKVYDGQLVVPPASTSIMTYNIVRIDLDTPFYYNNVDNLVIAFEENTPGYTDDSDEFFCDGSSLGSVSIYFYNDYIDPDPTAPPTLGEDNSSLSNYFPCLGITFGELGTPDATDLYISEISDNITGQDDGTGYVEIYNNANANLDVSGCSIIKGNEVAGEFVTALPMGAYYIPAGTVMTPKSYLVVGNGADETTFKTAWGITGDINYLAGDVALDITNGWAYQLNPYMTREELDHSPNVPVNEEIVQSQNGTWQSGDPLDATPGGVSDGQTLPVELSSFTAIVTASKTVMLEWMTQSETGMIGYHVLRGDTNVAAEAIRLTDMVIEAENSSDETAYSYEDLDVAQQRSYYYWLEALSADGETDLFGPVFATVLPDTPHEPDFFATTMLQANCPNPFNPSTEIAFELRGTEGVPVQAELAVYNVRGQRVKTLVSGMMEPGAHSVTWNGTDENGRTVSSGVYFYRLTAPNFNQMRKMMLLK